LRVQNGVWIVVLVAAILAVPISEAITETSATRPNFLVTFDEPTTINSYSLKSQSGDSYGLSLNSLSEENISYFCRYNDSRDLQYERIYTFSTFYSDILGNNDSSSLIFKVTACVDNDHDGFYANNGICPDSNALDCNDNDASINPNASEICGNDVDENCDGNKMLCPVNLRAITAFPNPINLTVGDSVPINVYASYSDGSSGNPVSTSSHFSVNDSSIAQMNGSAVYGLKKGSARVLVSYTESSVTRNTSVLVNVYDKSDNVTFSWLKINPTRSNFKVGEVVCDEELLTAVLYQSNPDDYAIVKGYKLISGNTSVISIVNNTCISAKNAGFANVWASYNGLTSNNISVGVWDWSDTPPTLRISPQFAVLYPENGIAFSAYLKGDDGLKDVTGSSEFASSNQNVLQRSLNPQNSFAALSVGRAAVSAQYGLDANTNLRAEASVLVLPAPEIMLLNNEQYPDLGGSVFLNRSRNVEIVTSSAHNSEFGQCFAGEKAGNVVYYLYPMSMNEDGTFSAFLNASFGKEIYVKCNDTSGNWFENKFNLYPYDAKPAITSAGAPSVYENPLQTVLSVKTSEPTACRYDSESKNYDEMADYFPGDNDWLYSGHTISKGVLLDGLSDHSDYVYYVACKGLSGLISDTAEIRFSVNTSAPADIIIESPQRSCVSGSFDFRIRVTQTPQGCSAGNSTVLSEMKALKQSITDPHVFYSSGNAFSVSGNSTLFSILCQLNGPNTALASKEIFIDDSQPYVSVDDSSEFSQKNVSPYADRLHVRIKGGDPGVSCGLDRYSYQVYKKGSGTAVSENTSVSLSSKTSFDKSFYIEDLELENGTAYFVKVWLADNSGRIVSNSSDGITVDTTFNPCSDGVKDGLETDVDCGSQACAVPCDAGKNCTINLDCKSGLCNSSTKKCAELNATCSDQKKNGNETDVDCGGNCPDCLSGKGCLNNSDCRSGACDNSTHKCVLPNYCSNGVQDPSETDKDCGGKCDPCGLNQKCKYDSDCSKDLACINGACLFNILPDFCSNKKMDKDKGETDIDCGGSCGKCSGGDSCLDNLDCSSGTCDNVTKTCWLSDHCSNNFKDGDETDVDCGGSCGKCGSEKACLKDSDCTSGFTCSDGNCKSSSPTLPEHCGNGEKDADETDVDCGGSCNPCAEGNGCTADSDCESGFSCVENVCSAEQKAGKSSNLLLILLVLLLVGGGAGLYYYYASSKKKSKSKKALLKAPPRFNVPGEENPYGPPEDLPLILRKRKEEEKGVGPLISTAGMNPEDIARIRAKIRTQERESIFNKFDKGEGEKKAAESPIYELPEEKKEEKEEAKENKEEPAAKKKPEEEKQQKYAASGVFEELEKISRNRPEARKKIFEDLQKVAESKKKRKRKPSKKR